MRRAQTLAKKAGSDGGSDATELMLREKSQSAVQFESRLQKSGSEGADSDQEETRGRSRHRKLDAGAKRRVVSSVYSH